MRYANELIGYFLVMAVMLGLLYVVSLLRPREDDGNRYWNSTILFVWLDVEDKENPDLFVRGRYEVRLPAGNNVYAYTTLSESFARLDCVIVKETVSYWAYSNTFEIIERTENCWQPD